MQIALTRLLSTTVSYHAAFLVIALVMLGLAGSGTAVFLQRNRKEDPATLDDAVNNLLYGAAVVAGAVVAFVLFGMLPTGSLQQPVQMLIASCSFFFGFYYTGYAVAFLLSEYHSDITRVYWSDLTGAALGCMLVVPMMDFLSAVNVMLVCAVGCAAAAMMLSSLHQGPGAKRSRIAFGALTVVTIVAVLFPSLTELRYAKGQDQRHNLWLNWNHLARVTVTPNIPSAQWAIDKLMEKVSEEEAFELVNSWQTGWGMSETYPGDAPKIVWVQLDTDAGTQIIKNGVSRVGHDLPFLEYDVTSTAHLLKKDAIGNAFVIGGGGGRDILAALHFGADDVYVVELNPDVVRAVDDVFGDFSGKPYSHPSVHLTIGEARSELSRNDRQYDLIQMSMIDTWAASMAGSMTLTENTLYTTEAYDLYFDHLTDDGVFTTSRWYKPEDFGEVGRVLALMDHALRSHGVTDPSKHIAVVYAKGAYSLNVATLTMKRSPFTEEELAALSRSADELGFHTLWPNRSQDLQDPIDVEAILSTGAQAQSSFIDLTPPRDDRPFFFNTKKPVASWVAAIRTGDLSKGNRNTMLIGAVICVLLIVARRLVVTPLQQYNASLPESERATLAQHIHPMAYFAGIGLGFMWVELALIQRYIVFLGHPTYALSVSLLALLFFSAIGSGLSSRLSVDRARSWSIGAVLVGVLLTAFVVPMVTDAAHGWSHLARIVLAVTLIAPLGVVMGMIYPTGVRLLEKYDLAHLVPWAWAINGVCSVFASTFGMLLAINFGYTALVLCGGLAYAVTGWAAMNSWQVARAR
jgi:spermidine synthase